MSLRLEPNYHTLISLVVRFFQVVLISALEIGNNTSPDSSLGFRFGTSLTLTLNFGSFKIALPMARKVANTINVAIDISILVSMIAVGKYFT